MKMLRRFVYDTCKFICASTPLQQCIKDYSTKIKSSHIDLEHIKQKILKETEISRDHLTPELALRLITPTCRLFNEPVVAEADAKVFVNDPFWGFYWPGGQALSRYILDNPCIVKNKSVLDLGSGCGASTLAALLSEAKYVVANDIDEAATCATLINATLNNICIEQIKISTDNLIGSRISEDLILLGDVFYDEEFAMQLLPWLQQLKTEGKEILIGDPGRHGLTEKGRLNFMHKLATYELTANACIENNGFKHVHVWRFKV